MRGIISATFLLVTSAVYAGHPAAGVQVLVNRGGATVFKGITDAAGQFTTDTLEPGEYQVEVRGPKVVPPVRYFLILSGARPMGQTMTNAAGDLGLQAQVRRPVSIRGQVSSSRIIVLNNPVASPNPSSASAARNLAPNTQPPAAVPLMRSPAAASSASMTAPSVTRTIPSSSTPASTRATPVANPNPTMTTTRSPASSQPPLRTPAAATASAPGAPPSRIIDGKRYIWVPSAPGSKLGRWMPATAASAPVGMGGGATGTAATQTSAASGR